jgi:hypothetical protein
VKKLKKTTGENVDRLIQRFSVVGLDISLDKWGF